MSPKELMYIEDALGHEKQVKATCMDSANQLQDAELKQLVADLSQRHASCFSQLYTLLK